MSFNRENVIWKSPDGTWNRGFFVCEDTWNTDDDDYDSEWDVEYDYGQFSWVSRGHLTEDAAVASWKGANPGGWCVYTDPDDENIARFERMCEEYAKGNMWTATGTY